MSSWVQSPAGGTGIGIGIDIGGLHSLGQSFMGGGVTNEVAVEEGGNELM